MSKRKLSLVPWQGGKLHLCAKIIKEISRCNMLYSITTYCEPCAGGARVLLNKSPHSREILNDMNNSLMTLWAVVQHPIGREELIRKLESYPYSKDFFDETKQKIGEYEKGLIHLDMPTVAANMYLLAYQSRVAALKSFKQFRDTRRNDRTRSSYYLKLRNIRAIYHRVKNVELRQGDCIILMRELMNDPAVLCYIDPSYWETRSYDYNLTCIEHQKLVDFLPTSKNKFILSGYDNSEYQRLVDEFGWTKKFLGSIPVPSSVNNGKCRRADEFIWMNF